MKILIDGRLYGLENAGLGRYLINLISELSQIDHDNNYILLLRGNYFKTLKLPGNWKKVLADFRHYSLKEQFILPKIINRESPDIVHFPHFNVPLFYRGNFIVTIHDLLMHKQTGFAATTLIPPLYILKRLGYKLIFGNAVKRSLKIIVPSNAVKNELLNVYKLNADKVSVIYEGFDKKIIENFDEIQLERKYNLNTEYFIYTGNAYPHKNLKRLIDATLLLNKYSVRKYLLVIVSSRNIFTQRLQKVINKYKASEFIRQLGFVPDNDLGIMYKRSIAFITPSISEGFGLPGIEAMSAGTLVLASDIPVFKEIYGKAAIYFNPLDFTAIEKGMRDVIEMDNQTRSEKILFAQKFVGKYSWSKMANETIRLYKEVGK